MESLKVDNNHEELEKSFKESLKDTKFKEIVSTLGIRPNLAMKYTSLIADCAGEQNNCATCKGLNFCKNKVNGCYMMPLVEENKLTFAYKECQYKEELEKKQKEARSATKELAKACFKDLDVTDKKRKDVLTWIKKFYDNFDFVNFQKGLYLHGNFGCGKTYIIASLFNELKKKGARCEIVYFPTLLRNLKSDFDNFGDEIAYLLDVDLLLIDDIGAEKVTEWSRDEVLATILQERMENYKSTFFTSNLNLEELERHFRTSNNNSDEEIKIKRILERIKYMTIDMELLSENKRK